MHASTMPSGWNVEHDHERPHDAHHGRARLLGQQEPATDLQEIEQHVLRIVKELGATLVAGLCSLLAPSSARSAPWPVPADCPHATSVSAPPPSPPSSARSPPRPYYLCAACGQGQHPLDAQLNSVLAVGAQALTNCLPCSARPKIRLPKPPACWSASPWSTSVPIVCATRRKQLGAELVVHQAQAVARAMDGHDEAPAVTVSPRGCTSRWMACWPICMNGVGVSSRSAAATKPAADRRAPVPSNWRSMRTARRM